MSFPTGNTKKVQVGTTGFAFRTHSTPDGQSPTQQISGAFVTLHEYRCLCFKTYWARQGQRKSNCGCRKRLKGLGPLDRFVSKIHFGESCWLWVAAKNGSGYGTFWHNKKLHSAHKFSYELHHGPTNLEVMHKCDVRLCVRPEHLTPGTHAENMADMVKKGRHVGNDTRGSKNGMAKLTELDVKDILTRSDSGQSDSDIAATYRVSRATIYFIVRGKTWVKVFQQHHVHPRH